METLKRVGVVLLAGGFLGGLAGAVTGRPLNAALSSAVGPNPCSDAVATALARYQALMGYSALGGALLAAALQGYLAWRLRKPAPASPPGAGA